MLVMTGRAVAEKRQVLWCIGLVLLQAMAEIFIFQSADDMLVNCGSLQDDVAPMKALYIQCHTDMFSSDVVPISRCHTDMFASVVAPICWNRWRSEVLIHLFCAMCRC